jgi:hypothetical protein
MVNKTYLILLFFAGCGEGENPRVLELDKNPRRDALFAAATDSGFSLDGQIKNKLENQERLVLGRLYLENVINSRVSVSMDEVEEYYKKTKNQHIRLEKEFLVLKFVAENLSSAQDIRKKLLGIRKNNDEKKLGALIAEHSPSRELLGENKIKKTVRNQFFGGSGSVVGPLSAHEQHVVFRVISTYEKGTTKEQIHVEEALRNQLFAMKAHALRQNIVDSLKSKYVDSK